MTIPDSVKVGPFEVRVSTDRTELLEACHKTQTNLMGHFDPRSLSIMLDEGLHPDMLSETLLHEVLHAMLTVTGLDNELERDLDEVIVNRLAPVLLAFLRDNPEAVKHLRG